MQPKILTDDKIVKITSRIKIVFIIFIAIGILNVIQRLLKLSEGVPQGHSRELIVNLFVFLFLYVGLRLRKKWFIPLVLISSAWLLLTSGVHILQPVADVWGLIAKIVSMVFFMFYAYQMYFFSRREVKEYFGVKEAIFF